MTTKSGLEKIIEELRGVRDVISTENKRKMHIDDLSNIKVSSELGTLVGVIYRKGNKNYIHEFKTSSRPKLAVKAGKLHIVGGRYEVTKRGIEDR